ncbi:Cystathionine beta-lyase PatB [Bacillus sp. THAF10]|uniref:MalY/PatB family protein n=1 Tax=Bacillus sp. THAF10 TaxID=2587848 RepID=UPI0012684BDF|nr:MalY/PatB family protein [Bacillus sp. THAF10]QFT90390.1 Cystathionine beta-lyase PatB [Bacillus sp. THAF10]
MLKYDFDKYFERQNTSSVKWDERKRIFGTDDVLPMWVADMDFQAPPEVIEAIQTKAEHGIYGYTSIPSSTAHAIISWYQRRHNWHLEEDWFTYISGVVPALSACIQTFSKPGDKVMVFAPVYYPFYDMIQLNDRELVICPLIENNGRMEMCMEEVERQLKKDVRLLLVCNPHNPGGTVWKKDELTELAALCVKHEVLVVSDEIHGDLTFPPYQYTPFASISKETAQRTITLTAPTKTFNIAGIQASVIITENKAFKEKLENFMKKQGLFTLNVFGITAMEAAYMHGEAWLEGLLQYLKDNLETAVHFINSSIPNVKAEMPEGTYLLWIDCRGLEIPDAELHRILLKKGKLALEPGTKFGRGGEGFLRMNVACSRGVLLDGLNRLQTALDQ